MEVMLWLLRGSGRVALRLPSSSPDLTITTSNAIAAVGAGGLRRLDGSPLNRSVSGVKRRSGKINRPFGRLWPHGEFTLCWRPAEVDAGEGEPLPFTFTDEQLAHACEQVVVGEGKGDGGAPDGDGLDPFPASGPKSSQRPKRPETYGRKGITRSGARSVRAAAYLLQERYGKDRLSFVTLTVPPLPDGNAVELAEGWGEVVRQLLQWLTRQLTKAGLTPSIVSVTEFQPRRSGEGRLESLHLHLVFCGRGVKETWAVTPGELKVFWESLLSRVSGTDARSEKWPYMKAVEKSASDYLGKYMSKGATGIASLAEEWGWSCIPRQWWNMTAPMRSAVKRATLSSSVVGEYLESIVDAYFSGPDWRFPGYLQAVHILLPQSNGSLRAHLAGYAGRFGPVTARDVYAVAVELVGQFTPLEPVLKSA